MYFSVQSTKKEDTIMFSGRIVTQDVNDFRTVVMTSLEKKKSVSLDLSRVSFLCPDGVQTLLELTMHANEKLLHCRVDRISDAAYSNIHTVRFASRLLSGELNQMPFDGEMIPLPDPQPLPPKPQSLPLEPQPLSSSSQSLPLEPQSLPSSSQSLPLEPQPLPSKLQPLLSELQSLGQKKTKELRNESPIVVRLSTNVIYEGQWFKTTIGRAEFSDICVETDTVSRMHAHIVNYCDQKYIVADPSSTNLTLVDGELVDKGTHKAIRDEAWLELADERFYIAFGDAKFEVQTYKELVFLYCQETREFVRVPHKGMILGKDNPWPGDSLNDKSIAGKHAELIRKRFIYSLVAYNSVFGTRCDNQAIKPGDSTIVNDKSIIQLGNRSFVFRRLQLVNGNTKSAEDISLG